MVCACAVLSPLVVLKRLSFVGQGVSHSAFGGVGVAAVLGALAAGQTSVVGFCVIGAFCIAAALGMALVGDRRGLALDTAIGVFLAASMALGIVLLHVAGLGARARACKAAVWRRGFSGALWESD